MRRLFLDTNIVIDLLGKRDPFYEDVVRLFTLAYHKKLQLVVSSLTFATASYVLQKSNSSEAVRNLLANFRQLTQVAITDERVVDDAIASPFNDFEDAIQYYTALKAKADAIITRNGKDFVFSKLPVMTAAEYLSAL